MTTARKQYPTLNDRVHTTVTRWQGSEGRWRSMVFECGLLMADEFFQTREAGVIWGEGKRAELLGKAPRGYPA